MSIPKKGSKAIEHSMAGAIKDAMARRRVGLIDLSAATGIPYRTLQNYLLETNAIPARAVSQIAQALDVSADWLLLGREPNLDKETLKLVLDYFDEFIRPKMDDAGTEAAVEEFIKLHERIYIHQYSLPSVPVRLAKRRGKQTRGKPGGA